jgi:hypothetical protein
MCRDPCFVNKRSLALRSCQRALVILTILQCCSGCSRGRKRLEETIQIGNEVVSALDAFMKDNEHYPDSLGELSPKYIGEIPSPAWGLRQWKYSSQGKEFSLSVDESRRTGDGNSRWLRYRPDGHGWQIGD